LFESKSLKRQEAEEVLTNIATGTYTEPEIAAFLTVYLMRSITVEELSGFRDALLNLCIRVDLSGFDTIDVCGTGGDGKDTFNISTLSTFVLAGAGAKVAKHGNYGVSSACGSSNILEYFGYKFSTDPDKLQRETDQAGVCFLHAPLFNPAMKNVAPVRREMGVRTIFNILGPLTNPAGAPNQLMGVFHPDLVGIQVRVMQRLGAQHVLVVWGKDGMDEISLGAATLVGELKNGEITEYEIHPEDFGLAMVSNRSLRVENAEQSKTLMLAALDNHPGAARDIVAFNAGAALYAANISPSIDDGIWLARDVLANGAARAKLDEFVRCTQTLAS